MRVTLRDIEVSVRCDGRELPIHGLESSDESALSAYIPSESNKAFTVLVKNSTNHDISCRLYADGQQVRSHAVRRGDSFHCEGARVSGDAIVPLQFADLQLVDEDSEVPTAVDSNQIGEIRIVFCRLGPSLGSRKRPFDNNVALGGTAVSERNKKAGAHRVALDYSSQKTRKYKATSRERIDRLDSPYATFRFTYMPEALLRARDIIPRRGTTMPASRQSPVKRALTDAQSERPAKRERQVVSAVQSSRGRDSTKGIQPSSFTVNNQQVDVKPNIGVLDLTNLDDGSTIAVKRERGPVPPIVPGEVIDLT
ncbi:hypothetical protein PENSPDRAFT_687002 [Peniophora sp. CONT]|nr:hypothetical protein PENSPDRAFT_687002 [Peniophora sp. CONT]